MTKFFLAIFLMTSTVGCSDFLDVVPDNVASLDHAFANKREAERFLATLYALMPSTDLTGNILFVGADDVWTYYENHYSYMWAWKIAMGEQNVDDPFINAWNGRNSMKSMFRGIRDCNIFLEEIRDNKKVPELDIYTRARWIAEANFLKAYYHFYLFRMYGTIPIVDKNLSPSSSPEEVKVSREPVDKVVNYIVDLLDNAAKDLPLQINDMQNEAGRVTKGAALMLKARLLATAASPLFNGNPDYEDFVDKDGNHLIPVTYDQTKWDRALKACEETLDNIPGVSLYEFPSTDRLSARTKYQLRTRGVVTEKFNSETIWGRFLSHDQSKQMQAGAFVPWIDPKQSKTTYGSSYLSVTFGMTDRFYTKNGVPIDEDKTWNYSGRYNTVVVSDGQEYNIKKGYTTAQMNLDRENRFYGSLIFDGALVYLQSSGDSDETPFEINAKFGQRNGVDGYEWVTVTGYWVRKLTHWTFAQTDNGFNTEPYPWPEMRLTDLLLLYAECLNEIGRADDAIYQLDILREKVGLKGVKESWQNFSRNPNKPNTQEGLREIIHQEREIELAFEGHRLWDMRRWKKAAIYQNRNVMGWNVRGKTATEYYQPITLFEQQFIVPRDYLWPLWKEELLKNKNLVQNPGWN